MLDIVAVFVDCLFPSFALNPEGDRRVSSDPEMLERKYLPAIRAVHRPSSLLYLGRERAW